MFRSHGGVALRWVRRRGKAPRDERTGDNQKSRRELPSVEG